MAETSNVNLDPIIPSQYELNQTHISTDRKSFMLMIEAKLKKLVNDYADPKTSSIYIDDQFYADKFSGDYTCVKPVYYSFRNSADYI